MKTLAQSLPPGPQEEEEERGSAYSLLLLFFFFLCVSPLLDYDVVRSHLLVLLAPVSSSGSSKLRRKKPHTCRDLKKFRIASETSGNSVASVKVFEEKNI